MSVKLKPEKNKLEINKQQAEEGRTSSREDSLEPNP